MHRILHFIFYVSFTSLFGCAAGNNTTTRSEFTDDLTQYRIDVETMTQENNESSSSSDEVDWSSLQFEASVTDEIDTQVSEMSRTNLRVDSFPGFRIQLYSAGDRNKASELIEYLKEELEIKEPIYLHYEQPNYKVKIGDFTSRVKAHEMHFSLKEEYPYSIVIRDNISFDLDDYLNPKEDK